MARDLTYTHYYKVWSNLIITAVVPILVLIFCNTSILVQMRKTQNGRNLGVSRQVSNNQHQENHSLILILAGIVVVFIVCHSFRFFLAFYQVSTAETTRLCIERGREAAHPSWLYVISAVNHLMLMVNSSVIFIIYCVVGSKFRKALTDKLFGKQIALGKKMHNFVL